MENMEKRISTGIEGLDEMVSGGIPEGHTVALLGSFGTGKTTFAMQFIYQGLQQGEKGIVISLEEDVDSIIKSCDNYGLDIKPHIDKKELIIVKLEPGNVKTTLTKIKGELSKTIRDFGAKRIAVDSVSLLNMLFDTPAERRATLFNLCQQIKSSGATALLTAEVRDDNTVASRDGLVEYVADGVILLKYEELASREVKLTLRIVKMRRASHTREIKLYDITKNGLVVLSKAEVFLR